MNPCDPVKMSQVEIVLIIDGDGNYGVGRSYETAKNDYDEYEEASLDGLRVYHLNLAVPLPVADVVTGTLPDVRGGEVALTVV